MITIEPLGRSEIPAVASLFTRAFLRGRAPTQRLENALAESFLEHPWMDPESPSLVARDEDGNLAGFIGGYPVRIRGPDGTVIRTLVASTVMVDPDGGDPTAAARLFRRFVGGAQDVTICETANERSASIFGAVGAEMLGPESLDWMRVIRPAGTVLSLAQRRASVTRMLRPAAAIADRVLERRMIVTPANPARGNLVGRSVAREEFARSACSLIAAFDVAPLWDEGVLTWLIAQAERKDLYGPLHLRVLETAQGAIAGAYAVHGRPGAIARVLNVIATERAIGSVLDDLFALATAKQWSAVRGRAEAWLLPHLARRQCFFQSRGSAMIQSRRREHRDLWRRSVPAMGLGAETWSPLLGNEFHSEDPPSSSRS